MAEYDDPQSSLAQLAAMLDVTADTLDEHGTESEIVLGPDAPESLVVPSVELIRHIAIILRAWHELLTGPIDAGTVGAPEEETATTFLRPLAHGPVQ